MPQFAYKARRRSGEVVQDVLDAPDRAAVLTQLDRMGLFPVMVDASRGAGASAPRSIHHDWEQTHPIKLSEHGGAIRRVKHILDDLAGATPGFVSKLWHRLDAY